MRALDVRGKKLARFACANDYYRYYVELAWHPFSATGDRRLIGLMIWPGARWALAQSSNVLKCVYVIDCQS